MPFWSIKQAVTSLKMINSPPDYYQNYDTFAKLSICTFYFILI